MKQMHNNGQVESSPNSYCYTNVINSCAYCIQEEEEKKLSLAIAVQTYKEMLKDENAEQKSHHLFDFPETALRNLLPNDDKRTAAVHEVFKTQSTQNWSYFLSTTVPTEDEKQLGQCS
mmetsp:Transcript_19440/g.45439  ORF Transcript_19440/g.45439 Transcript_19440/m.45439 type:complete len:118 (+) Transcript_19440:127-480(+)